MTWINYFSIVNNKIIKQNYTILFPYDYFEAFAFMSTIQEIAHR